MVRIDDKIITDLNKFSQQMKRYYINIASNIGGDNNI